MTQTEPRNRVHAAWCSATVTGCDCGYEASLIARQGAAPEQARDTGGLREAARTVAELLDNAQIEWGKYPELDAAHDALAFALSQGAAHEERGLDVRCRCARCRVHDDAALAATTPEAAPEYPPNSIAETPEDNR